MKAKHILYVLGVADHGKTTSISVELAGIDDFGCRLFSVARLASTLDGDGHLREASRYDGLRYMEACEQIGGFLLGGVDFPEV